jgi:hypothetical protein
LRSREHSNGAAFEHAGRPDLLTPEIMRTLLRIIYA